MANHVAAAAESNVPGVDDDEHAGPEPVDAEAESVDVDDEDEADEADEADVADADEESDGAAPASTAVDAVSATDSASCQWHTSADQPATSGNRRADERHGATAAEVRRSSGGSGSKNPNGAVA